MLSGWGRMGNSLNAVQREAWGVGGGGVGRTIGSCMLERCRVRSGANWGQFQQSSVSALIPQLNWMKDILLPSPRREEGKARWRGVRVWRWGAEFFYLTNKAWCSTNCFLYCTDNLYIFPCAPLPNSGYILAHAFLWIIPPLFPANINPDGLYQCFVSLSVLPWLALLFSPTEHSKSELWSSHDLSDSGLKAWSDPLLISVCVGL